MNPGFAKYDPFRTPQWRAERVIQLVERGGQPPLRPKKYDDEFVRTYRRFLIEWKLMEAEAEQLSLFPLYPGIYHAHNWYYHQDPEWKAILEARILTGESHDDIADRFGTFSSVVTWYERLFFNVSDRMEASDWVIKSILGTYLEQAPSKDGALTIPQRAAIYKLFGYNGGPYVLDAMINGFGIRPAPYRRDEVGSWMDDAIKDTIRTKTAAGGRFLQTNKYNMTEMMAMLMTVLNHDAAVKGVEGGGSVTSYYEHVETFISSISWGLAHDKTVLSSQNQKQQKFLTSAVEPRTDEAFELAAGKLPKSLQTDVEKHDRNIIDVVTSGAEDA